MDGVSNIKAVLLPLVKGGSEEAVNDIGTKNAVDRNKLLKTCFIIILVAFAVYIEWQQFEIFLNRLKNP